MTREEEIVYNLVVVLVRLNAQGDRGWNIFWALSAYWDREST